MPQPSYFKIQRRKIIKISFQLLIVPMILTGCASLNSYPRNMLETDNELSTLEKYFSADIIDKYNSKTGEAKKTFRDEVINSRIRAINILFNEFVKDIQKERKLLEMGTDWAVIALNSTAVIITPPLTKSILSAVSAGIVGAKGSVDKNLFYEKTMPVLISQMEANRKKVLVNVRLGMTQNTNTYSLSQALIDLDDYYKQGTLPAAILAINAAAGTIITTSDKDIKNIVRGAYIKDSAGDILRSFWKKGGKINMDNESALKDWLKQNGMSVSIPFFIRNSSYDNLRIKAVKDLSLN